MKRKEIVKKTKNVLYELEVILEMDKTEVKSKDFYEGGKYYLEILLDMLEEK